MTWMLLGLASALFLGFYDICKKGALKDNAVLPVLFWATFCGSLTTLPFLLISRFLPDLLQSSDFFVHQLPLTTNLLILLKSVIVGSSWICAYYSLKHLPISIVAPIRSSSPFWALIGAIIIYGENPSYMQFFGIAVVLVSFYAFSLVGKLESIHFHRDKWIWLIILATLLGTCSGLYDKHLLQQLQIPRITLQVWFSIYLTLFIGLVTFFLWFPKQKEGPAFHWHWCIPFIGILLIIADFFYFKAMHMEGAMISILTPIRRSSSAVAFFAGGIIFKEKNKRLKALALAGVFAGIILIILGK